MLCTVFWRQSGGQARGQRLTAQESIHWPLLAGCAGRGKARSRPTHLAPFWEKPCNSLDNYRPPITPLTDVLGVPKCIHQCIKRPRRFRDTKPRIFRCFAEAVPVLVPQCRSAYNDVVQASIPQAIPWTLAESNAPFDLIKVFTRR